MRLRNSPQLSGSPAPKPITAGGDHAGIRRLQGRTVPTTSDGLSVRSHIHRAICVVSGYLRGTTEATRRRRRVDCSSHRASDQFGRARPGPASPRPATSASPPPPSRGECKKAADSCPMELPPRQPQRCGESCRSRALCRSSRAQHGAATRIHQKMLPDLLSDPPSSGRS
jgi:hypothetical protein